MKIVIYGLTITSAWGNGHATTYRSLVAALAARGHSVRFVEYDAPWYRSNRDMPQPEFCSVRLFQDWEKEEKSPRATAKKAAKKSAKKVTRKALKKSALSLSRR